MLRKHPDKATWWSVTPNGSGGDMFAPPVVISCTWQDRAETYIGQIDRRELISKAHIITDRAIAVGDYLAPGDQGIYADPTMVLTAEKVQRYQKAADLRNLQVVHKVIL